MSRVLFNKCVNEAEKLGIGKDNYIALVNGALEIYHFIEAVEYLQRVYKEGGQNAVSEEQTTIQN